jgi:hypothetical protein
MPVDVSKLLEKLPAVRREAALRIGAQFASENTLRQADDTLRALKQYGDEVTQFGYGDEDAEELTGLRDALSAAGAGRQGARAGKKTTSQALDQAIDDGKAARLRAHAILDRAQLLVAEAPTAQRIGAILAQTRSAGADAQKLFEQLKILQPILEDKEVAAVIKKRGGPEAIAALKQAMTKLIDAKRAHAGGGGSPAETARMDLLDGLIVDNVRDARRAARAAGKALGRPEIARAFELGALYESRRSRRSPTPSPEPPIPADPAPTP